MSQTVQDTLSAAPRDPLDQGNIGALINGRHGAPFDILGPHALTIDGRPYWVVRAFVPGARAITLLPAAAADAALAPLPLPLRELHPFGLFSVVAPGSAPARYQLEIERQTGVVERRRDPYAFPPLLSDFDLHLIGEGRHQDLYERMGAHRRQVDGVDGVNFAVWAPNARRMSVVGDFNSWDERAHPMRLRSSGVWELFLPEVTVGALYKYAVLSWNREYRALKADPFAFAAELRPGTASRVWDLSGYVWGDTEWMNERGARNAPDAPMAIYELHAASWKPSSAPDSSQVTYRDLANQLVPYIKDLGYTHIELMPIAEHPFDGSWGYQVTGYYAPTSRYGTPQDFMYFVDVCHQAGIGVLVDWVPAHFPKDEHGLNYFDGTHLYDHADPRQGEHPEWGTLVFNFGRNEVRNFLIANALFWFERYHIDGLRVDAVASMLYLDYAREPGEWMPNRYGGRENLEAVSFIRECNTTIHTRQPDVLTIAEESTAWPYVTAPVVDGGLGFSLKWNMGWMHDILEYMHYDPIHRSYHQNELTFSFLYAFSEKFVLPFSHDEVVHMKGSLLNKMPGDRWQKFANLRALYAFMYAHPGKKLLFMGAELAQWSEWNFAGYLDWYLLDPGLPDGPEHGQAQTLVRDLNRLMRAHPALYECDFSSSGFEWIDGSDTAHSVIAFMRYGKGKSDPLVVVCNFTPVPHHDYRVGVPYPGHYEELLNTDAAFYGGSNVGNLGGADADAVPMHGHAQSVPLTLPPLAAVILRPAAPPTLDPPGAERAERAANGRTPRPRAKAGTNA
jgi:1,4-alpha-glucan branching enzyme